MRKMLSSRKRTPIVLTVALAAALLSSGVPSAYADDSAAVATVQSLGQVSLTGSSYVEVKQVNLLSDQAGRVVTFTVSVTNDGSKDISFVDYWVRLMTKGGAQFTVKMMPQDKDKNTIPAGSTKELTFYSTINDDTSLSDLKFRIIKWDFSVDSFERTLGEIEVPNGFSNVTPAGSSVVTKLAGTSTKLTVSKFTLGKNEKYSLPNITLKLENADTHSLTVPAYQFAVRTQDGLMYPLEAKGLKDLAISPQDKKEITLAGSVPASVSTEGWQLVITQNLADLKLNVSIASFELPAVGQQDGSEAGKEVQFTDEHGLYTAKLNGIYRLPWEDQDILSADIMLANKGSDSLPVPTMTGYFLLDGAVKVEAKVVTPAKVIGLANGSSIGLQVAAKVPYTYEFSKAKLVLQEKSGEITSDVLEFETPADVMNVPITDAAGSYSLTDPGYRSTFKIQGVTAYAGKTTDLYSAQVLVENQEKRFTNLAKLIANFRAADGTVYPASIADVKDKVGPGGKALVTVYSVLPKGANTSGMNVLLGESVTDGKLGGAASGTSTGAGGSAAAGADMYVKPFAFWLPQDGSGALSSFKNVPLFPYNLSLDHIATSLDMNTGLTLKFNYELAKDVSTVANVEGHKFVIGFEDEKGNKSFDLSFDAKDFEPKDTDAADTPQKLLKVGRHEQFKAIVADRDLIYKLEFLKSYKLSIFDEFQGHRKLLASQKIDWFTTTD